MTLLAETTKTQGRFGFIGKDTDVAHLENIRYFGGSIGICHLLTNTELDFQKNLAPFYGSATLIDLAPEGALIDCKE